MTPYDFVLCHVSSGTDLERACETENVDFARFVSELERNDRLRRQWERAEALWKLISETL